MRKLTSLSVFFPAYNEAANIPKLVANALDILPTIAKKFEVIIVNDGSTDTTARVVKRIMKTHKEVRLVSHDHNRGYGATLRTGIQSSNMDWIFWTDADGQFNLDTLAEFVKASAIYPVVIGYRKHRADTLIRKVNGELYTQLINLLFEVGVKDIDCAFKLIRSDLLQSLPLEATGAFTSAEILIRLHDTKVKMKQLPVPHFKREFGTPTGNSPMVVFKGLRETFVFFARRIFALQSSPTELERES